MKAARYTGDARESTLENPLMTDDAWIHDPSEHTNTTQNTTRAHHAPKWIADSACRVAATLQGAQAGGSERAQPERETGRGDVRVHRRFVVTTATNNVVPRWDTEVQRVGDAFGRMCVCDW